MKQHFRPVQNKRDIVKLYMNQCAPSSFSFVCLNWHEIRWSEFSFIFKKEKNFFWNVFCFEWFHYVTIVVAPIFRKRKQQIFHFCHDITDVTFNRNQKDPIRLFRSITMWNRQQKSNEHSSEERKEEKKTNENVKSIFERGAQNE